MRALIALLALVASVTAFSQTATFERTTFEQRPALTLANDKLELTISERGGAFLSLVLREDADRINPLWNPVRMNRELGRPAGNDSGFGHFICVDGFGQPSAAERAAGQPFHGEAYRQPWETQRSAKANGVLEMVFRAHLPMAQETLTRTVRLVDGENVIYVDSALESELGIDRPISWAEHTTIGSPFLEPEVTLTSVSGTRAQNRPYQGTNGGPGLDRRLASGRDFTWPKSVGLDGQLIDLTAPPANPHYVDHATVLVDPATRLGWIATVNTAKRLLIGYVFKREDFPWVMNWDSYPSTGKLARGLEFSTQPYDESRQESVARNGMFDAPTFRWLPAKATIRTSFLLFYSRVPAGFGKVHAIRIEQGQVVIEDAAQTRLALTASKGVF